MIKLSRALATSRQRKSPRSLHLSTVSTSPRTLSSWNLVRPVPCNSSLLFSAHLPSLLILSGTLNIAEEGKEDTLWSRPSPDSFLLFSEVLLQLLDPSWKSVPLSLLLDSSRSLYAQSPTWKPSCSPRIPRSPRSSTKSCRIWSACSSIEFNALFTATPCSSLFSHLFYAF